MSVIIWFTGKALDCESISTVFPRAKILDERSRSDRFQKRKYSEPRSANILVSRKGFKNLDGQMKDAVVFLQKNKVAIKKVMKTKGLEEAFISFPCTMENSLVAFYCFPPELALVAGELGLGMRLSLFKCSN